MPTLPASTVIDVNVTKQSVIQSLEDFGLLCVFTENTAIAIGEVQTFTSIESFDAVFSVASSMKSFGDVFFAQSPQPTKLLVARVDTAGSNYPDTIETVRESHDFYAVGLDDNDLSSAIMESIALKVQALELLLICSRDASDVAAVAATLKAANSTRVALIAVDDATVDGDRPDAAWLAVGLTRQAGSFNWAFNQLEGISPTGQSISTIDTWLSDDINVYAKVATTEWTMYGTTLATDKTYIDQIQAMDWLKITIEEDVLNLLNSSDKIPYTDAGVKSIESVILGVMHEAQSLEILDSTVRVTANAPSITTLTPEQKASRIAPTIVCGGRLSGAINDIVVNVNLEV